MIKTEFAKETWRDKTNLQQIFFILVGAMVALNATGLEYLGPVFGTWYGDVIVVVAFLLALVYMRVHDQFHIENMKQNEAYVAQLVAEMQRMAIMENVDFKSLSEDLQPLIKVLTQAFSSEVKETIDRREESDSKESDRVW